MNLSLPRTVDDSPTSPKQYMLENGFYKEASQQIKYGP